MWLALLQGEFKSHVAWGKHTGNWWFPFLALLFCFLTSIFKSSLSTCLLSSLPFSRVWLEQRVTEVLLGALARRQVSKPPSGRIITMQHYTAILWQSNNFNICVYHLWHRCYGWNTASFFFTRLSFIIKVTESCCLYFTLVIYGNFLWRSTFITLGYCQHLYVYESNLFSDVCRVSLDQVVSPALL